MCPVPCFAAAGLGAGASWGGLALAGTVAEGAFARGVSAAGFRATAFFAVGFFAGALVAVADLSVEAVFADLATLLVSFPTRCLRDRGETSQIAAHWPARAAKLRCGGPAPLQPWWWRR